MDKHKTFVALFFGIGAFIFLASAIYQYMRLIINKDKIKYIDAKAVEISTVVAETMKVTNSKWARVGFRIDGKYYVSSERIPVPIDTSMGGKVRVAYFKENPNVIFTANRKKASIFLGIGIICLAILIYLKVWQGYLT